jgi:Arc/MetJ family transcription regulator
VKVSCGPDEMQTCTAFHDKPAGFFPSALLIYAFNILIQTNIFEKQVLHNILLMCIFIQNNTHRRKIMRTNIVIDDNLMAEAIKLSQLKTKKAVVETGLRLLIQIKKQEHIKSLRGKLNWDGDLEKMRLDQ